MNRSVVDLLNSLKNSGRQWQTIVMEDLFNLLPAAEYQQLEEARERALAGHGRLDLDLACNKLIEKYRHDPPTRKLTML